MDRFGQGEHSQLQYEPACQLRYGNVVLVGHLANDGNVCQAPVRIGGIGLEQYAVLLAEFDKLEGNMPDVDFHLVYRRHYGAFVHDILEVFDIEIRNADASAVASSARLFQRLPYLQVFDEVVLAGFPHFVPRFWGVDKHQVGIETVQAFDGFLDTADRAAVGFYLGGDLGCHENLFAGDSEVVYGGLDATADPGFVVVGDSRVDMPVSRLDGGYDSRFCVFVGNLPRPEGELGDPFPVIHLVQFVNHHGTVPPFTFNLFNINKERRKRTSGLIPRWNSTSDDGITGRAS